MLAHSCTGCHGDKGVSGTSPMPSFGGQNETYLAATLKAYRDGKRPGTVMPMIMKGYTDGQINAIAGYFSKFEWKGAAQTIDATLIAKGKPIYSKSCSDCHPRGGRESKEADYPLLAGQWLAFLNMATTDVKTGKREVDDKFLSKIQQLSAEELEAVNAYFAAQQ